MKERQENFNPRVPKNISNLSNLDIKYNNLSFGDPIWVIPIGEETLEP